jgi:hypothetical protein
MAPPQPVLSLSHAMASFSTAHFRIAPVILRLLPIILTACVVRPPMGNATTLSLQSDPLLFSAYSLGIPEIDSARAAGFTAIGPYYGKDKSYALRQSDRAGLPLIYSVGPNIDFEKSDPTLDAAQLQLIANEVRETSKNSDIAIWNIANEELRHWRPRELEWLENISATIRANDPEKRPVMMYEPNHRRSKDLVITGQYLDIISKGAYANHVGMKDNRSWVRWSVEQTTTAADITGATPIAVLWMARDQRTRQDVANIERWVKHDIYLSLISGAKGILIFSGFNKRRGFRRHFSEFYGAYSTAAWQLNGPLNLGQIFLQGVHLDDITISIIDGPTRQQFSYRKEQIDYPSVHSTRRRFADHNWLFMVNSANEPVTLAITGLPDDKQIFDAFTDEPMARSSGMLMQALEVKALHWK